jgi:BirA family transcriptional regulator, biotin operon repressor / biotin---[acetyl-CoA-carboxylase] ligase
MVLGSLKAALNSDVLDAMEEVLVFSEIDSTNSELLRRYNKGKQGSALVIAQAQTNGRGRRGREWHSPSNGGLYMSLGMPFSNSTKDLQALSLVTAISVATALSSICKIKLELKWPNDVLASNKKLAGILLERHISQAQSYIVFGVGVNLEFTQEQRNAIDRPVTDLNSLIDSVIAPEIIAGAIVNELVGGVEKFLKYGFKPFKDIWNDYDRYAGADIVIDNGAERLIGKSLGVNEEGSLVLLTAAGSVTLNTGEIFPSLRELKNGSS